MAERPEKTLPSGPPLIEPGHTYSSITEKVSSIVLTRHTPKEWFVGFGIGFTLLMVFLGSTGYLLSPDSIVTLWGSSAS